MCSGSSIDRPPNPQPWHVYQAETLPRHGVAANVIRTPERRIAVPAATPAGVAERFEKLVADSGPPPIRLHDLRHRAATLMLVSGAVMKVVQDTLGHPKIVLTADRCASVLHEVAHATASYGGRARASWAHHPRPGTSAPNNKEAPQSNVIDFGANPQFSGGTSSF